MSLHSTCPVLTPIIYNEINFGVYTSYLRFVDGRGAIVGKVFTRDAIFRCLFGDAGLPIDNTLQCIALIDRLLNAALGKI